MLRIEGSKELNRDLLSLIPKQVASRTLLEVTITQDPDDPDDLLLLVKDPTREQMVLDALKDRGYTVKAVPA